MYLSETQMINDNNSLSQGKDEIMLKNLCNWQTNSIAPSYIVQV